MSPLLLEDSHGAQFECKWTVGTTTASNGTAWAPIQFQVAVVLSSVPAAVTEALDHVSIVISSSGQRQRISRTDLGSESAVQFLLDCLSWALKDINKSVSACLVLPRQSGYIVRSDILEQRLLGCEQVHSIRDFCTHPQQSFDGLGNASVPPTLQEAFRASVGGMITNTGALHAASLVSELENRLSFPWLCTTPPNPARRPVIGLVDAGLTGPAVGGTGSSIYGAAQALGIEIVAFDSPEHWVNDPLHRHWRKDMVALDCPLKPDKDFWKRIVKAILSYAGHLDAIMTFRDHYKPFVARAAAELGLPTYPATSYEVATDKYKTSVSEGHQAYEADSLEKALTLVKDSGMQFPIIIKPTNGFLSEGVSRVDDLVELEKAVQAVNTERHGTNFVIENYCSGPEVDANLVLLNGEVIFFEVSDDFPKGADSNGAEEVETFIELANVLPSALPAPELLMMQNSLQQSLLRMGFSDGFYHIEARVEDSSMEYTTQDGILDLRQKPVHQRCPDSVPSTWLIEVNPRPPGIQASEAVRYTYGIDYFALALLFTISDKERIKALSQPFASESQCWCEMVFIPVHSGGTFDSQNVCDELFIRRPDLARHVSKSFCFLKKGDKCQDPLASGVNSWVAYFIVVSRKSRVEVLTLAETIRRETRFSIVA